MGRLIVASEFFEAATERRAAPAHRHLDPSWYFSDAHYETSYNRGEGWRYSPESGFPYRSAIHITQWQKEMKVAIRRLVERRMLGSVFYRRYDISYSYRSSYSRGGEEVAFDSKVEHIYHEFRFEEREDQVLFDLQYAGVVGPVLERHPDFPDVTEDMIEAARLSPICY